jgi:16S rRNA (uracil1498-N3)-methyltransferase
MTHPRRFLCPSDLAHPPWRLEGDEARHILRSLRLGVGDCVTLMDGRGGTLSARIAEIGKSYAVAEPSGAVLRKPPPEVRPWLVVGAPEPADLDPVVEHAAELGAWRIAVVRAERSQAPMAALEKRLPRWRSLVGSAGKQSGNPWFPEVTLFPSVEVALLEAPCGGYLLTQGGTPLGAALAGGPECATGEFCLAVGPEGDFSPGELDRLRGAGLCPVSLGPHVLRTGTACLAALAMLAARPPTSLGCGSPLE